MRPRRRTETLHINAIQKSLQSTTVNPADEVRSGYGDLMLGLPLRAIPVSKLESGRYRPAFGLAEA